MVLLFRQTLLWVLSKHSINKQHYADAMPVCCRHCTAYFSPDNEMKFLILSRLAKFMPVLAIGALLCNPINSRAESHNDNNVIEKMQAESNGNVIIDIPDNLLDLILHSSKKEQSHDMKPGVNKLAGFRIQVFSDGRNQHTLEARAKARGSAILAKFPKYRGQIYTYSSSPNWYTRVGNFRTNAEANAALTELKKAFPNYSSEMRVVKSQIVVVKP